MRAAIHAMPDGADEFEDFVDNDGLSDSPVRLHAELTIAGDIITVDLTSCADQQRGPINCTPAMSNCAVYYALIAAADGAVLANAGCYRPITIIHRPGSVTDCRAPASVAHRVVVTHRLANVMFGALHQVMPERIPAAYYGGSYVATFQTIAADDHREVLVEIEIGGAGAGPDRDGASAWSCGMHKNSNIPIEMIDEPDAADDRALWPCAGSCGDSEHRGGLGPTREWRVDSPTCVFTANMDRFRLPPYSLAGGEPRGLERIRNGDVTPVSPKSDGVMLRKATAYDRRPQEAADSEVLQPDPLTQRPATGASATPLAERAFGQVGRAPCRSLAGPQRARKEGSEPQTLPHAFLAHALWILYGLPTPQIVVSRFFGCCSTRSISSPCMYRRTHYDDYTWIKLSEAMPPCIAKLSSARTNRSERWWFPSSRGSPLDWLRAPS